MYSIGDLPDEEVIMIRKLVCKLPFNFDSKCLKFSDGYCRCLKRTLDKYPLEDSDRNAELHEELERNWAWHKSAVSRLLYYSITSFSNSPEREIAGVLRDLHVSHENLMYVAQNVLSGITWGRRHSLLPGSEQREFDLILQPVSLQDFRFLNVGNIIECGLYTEKNQHLLSADSVGFVWNNRGMEVLCESPGPVTTHYSGLNLTSIDGDYKEVDFIFIGADNPLFWSYEDFTEQCGSESAGNIIYSWNVCEQVHPTGVFVADGSSEEVRSIVELASRLRHFDFYDLEGGVLNIRKL